MRMKQTKIKQVREFDSTLILKNKCKNQAHIIQI